MPAIRVPARLPRRVQVSWVDAHHLSLGEWVEDEDLREHRAIGVPAETVAWLVAQREGHLILAHSHDAEDRPGRSRHWTGCFVIPESAITALEPL